MFQFQKVRLKVSDLETLYARVERVSIPKGSIKSHQRDTTVHDRTRFQFQKVRLKDGSALYAPFAELVSIPKGSIKRKSRPYASGVRPCFNSKRFD